MDRIWKKSHLGVHRPNLEKLCTKHQGSRLFQLYATQMTDRQTYSVFFIYLIDRISSDTLTQSP